MTNHFDADHMSRTSLLFVRQTGNAVKGLAQHGRFGLTLVAGVETCATRTGQAALLTSVKTAARAFGRVASVLSDPSQVVLGGPQAGLTLRQAVEAEGVQVLESPPESSAEIHVVIGDVPFGLPEDAGLIAATWSGWTASVGPRSQIGTHAGSDQGNVLAAIAAGALAIAEAFFVALNEPGSDAGRRRVDLDLWAPTAGSAEFVPQLSYAPARWWLLGLGHLGQGYAHTISWLDYADPSAVQVVLQDTQRTVPANHSTGLLTPYGSHGASKARIAADTLESCGIDAVVVERRMDARTLVREDDMHVALIGVDNLPTRRAIDSFGWRTAIDVGLGAGVDDFDGITVLRFPGRDSAQIPAWRADEPKPREDPLFEVPGLDPCGVVQLEGVAVGASFVGAIAGVIAVAEAVRPLHGGSAHLVLCHGLREGEVDGGAASDVELPVAASLRQTPLPLATRA